MGCPFCDLVVPEKRNAHFQPRNYKKIQTGWGGGGGLTNIYFKVFFPINAVASLDYICLRVGRVRPVGVGERGLKANLIKKIARGTGGGSNRFEQTLRIPLFLGGGGGVKAIFYNLLSSGKVS